MNQILFFQKFMHFSEWFALSYELCFKDILMDCVLSYKSFLQCQFLVASKCYNLKQLFKAFTITSFFMLCVPKGHCLIIFFLFLFFFNSIHFTGCGLSTLNFTKPYPKWFELPHDCLLLWILFATFGANLSH